MHTLHVPHGLSIVPMWGLRDTFFPDLSDSGRYGIYHSVPSLSDRLIDPFIELISGCALQFEPASFDEIFGRESDETYALPGDHPRKLSPDEIGYIAVATSNPLLSGFDLVQDTLFGQNGSEPIGSLPPNEQTVIHHNYVGSSVLGGQGVLDLYPDSGTAEHYGLTFPRLPIDYAVPGTVFYDSVSGSFGGLGSWEGWWRCVARVDAIVEKIIDDLAWSGEFYQDGQLTQFCITGMTVLHAKRAVSYTYDILYTRYSMSAGSNSHSINFSMRRTIDFRYSTWSDYVLPSGLGNSGYLQFPVDLHVRIATLDDVMGWKNINPNYDYDPEYPPHIFTWLDDLLESSHSPYATAFSISNEGLHTWGIGMSSRYANPIPGEEAGVAGASRKLRERGGKLIAATRNNMGDLAPLTLYSATDAIQKHFDFVGQNILETLMEAEQIKGLFTPLTDVRAFVRAARGGTRLGTLMAFFDMLVDAQLLYSFMIAPGIQQVKDFCWQYDRIVNVLAGRGCFGAKTIYGSFRLALPDDFPIKDVVLMCHSKLRVVIEDTVLMTMLLNGNAVGILPRLANLWDCVSYSFVIDWFTRESDRLNALDWQAFLFTLPVVWCEHSIKLTDRWDDEFFNTEPAMTELTRSASSYYIRWTSGALPVLRFSRYDPFPVESPLDVVAHKAKLLGCMGYGLLKRL